MSFFDLYPVLLLEEAEVSCLIAAIRLTCFQLVPQRVSTLLLHSTTEKLLSEKMYVQKNCAERAHLNQNKNRAFFFSNMFGLVLLTTALRPDKLTLNKLKRTVLKAIPAFCSLHQPRLRKDLMFPDGKGDSPGAIHARNQQTHKCRKKQQQRLQVTSLKY